MPTPYFVNLPVRYALNPEPPYLEYFLEHGVSPEIGLDLIWHEPVPLDTHRTLARRIREAGLTCSVHLPFTDLQPGSLDDLIREATAERLGQALDLAAIYEPRLLVTHAGLNAMMYGGDLYPLWLERAAATWTSLLAAWPGHPPVFFENTFESSPGPTLDLIAAVADPLTGMCLDIGHWHSFAQGQVRNNLGKWLDAIAAGVSRLHLHLHDNDGSFDQHLGLGAGSIPFADLFAGLRARNLIPSVTLEPHTTADFERSQAFIASQPEMFAFLAKSN